MAPDDTNDHQVDDGGDDGVPDDGAETDLDAGTGIDTGTDSDTAADADGRNAAVEEVDQRIVDLLSWILDTETRAKIYVHLLANPGSTSEEVAKGTGLYPSTVREALAELHEEERVGREKRANEGAGNNPYEYTAIQPSDLVGGVVDQVQRELNTIFTLDRVLDRQSEDPTAFEDDVEPVKITVDDISSVSSEEDEPEAVAFDEGAGINRVETDADAEGGDEDEAGTDTAEAEAEGEEEEEAD